MLRDDQYFPIGGMYGSDWRADVSVAGGGTSRSGTSMVSGTWELTERNDVGVEVPERCEAVVCFLVRRFLDSGLSGSLMVRACPHWISQSFWSVW